MEITEQVWEFIEGVEGVDSLYKDYHWSGSFSTTGINIDYLGAVGEIWLALLKEMEELNDLGELDEGDLQYKKEIKDFAKSLARARINTLGKGYIIY